MKNCIFCNKENLVTDTVYEDELVMAFKDIEPINEGHILLIPKEHYLDVDEIPDETLSHLMIISKKMVSALKEVYKPDGYLMMSGIIICIFSQDIPGTVSDGHTEKKEKIPVKNKGNCQVSIINGEEGLL